MTNIGAIKLEQLSMKFDNTSLYYIESGLNGKRYNLYDLAKWKNGLAFKKINFSKKHGIPIIKISELNNGIGNTTNYTNGQYDRDLYLKYGDFLFSWSGNPQTSIDIFKFKLKEGWLNQHIFKVIPDDTIVYKDFFFYLMKWLKHNFINIARNKQTIGLGHVTIYDLKKLSVIIPNMEIQKRIASVLSVLDDKIDLNNAINENLEQQAQAIFKSWFIDFDPFGGVMPADWQIGSLKQILKLKRNTIKAGENKNLPYLPIDVIPMHSLGTSFFRPNNEDKSSLIKFDKDDIIIGAMRVYFHRVIIAPCDGITRTTCFTLTPYDFDYLCFSLLYCNQNSSIEYASKTSLGSTMPYAIWENGLGDMEIIIPSKKISFNFNSIILPLIRKIQENCLENQRLASLRDTLLPKLMNGEIDVSKVKI